MQGRDQWAKILFIVSLAFLSFLLGSVLVFFNKPPAPQLAQLKSIASDLARNGHAYFFDKPTGHLQSARFPSHTHGISDNPAASEGYVFTTGLFGNELGAILLDNSGNTLHRWPIDFFKVRPEKMKYKFHALIHGSWMYPNGDILINLDGHGLYRVSRCGDVLWSNDDRSHHSIFVDEAGFIWTPLGTHLYNNAEFANTGIRVDRVGKFDAETGALVEEIDLVEVLIKANLTGVALVGGWKSNDLIHLNDVEILSSQDAASFPGFSAGDIMLSLRNTNQIWILDGQTHELKWWRTGPALGQHDPDFQADGTITVFDNRPSTPTTAENAFLGPKGGSRIIALRPESYDYETLLESTNDFHFYTHIAASIKCLRTETF